MSNLLKLFISFFKIGLFSFGGGYGMLKLIEEEVITTHGWITQLEFIDVLAIAEMTPGPIAINAATFLGYRVYGIWGSVVATVAVVLPSIIVMGITIYFLYKLKESPYLKWFMAGIRPIILGLIASAAITMAMDVFVQLKEVIVCLTAFYLVTFKKLNPIFALILAGLTGLILY